MVPVQAMVVAAEAVEALEAAEVALDNRTRAKT